MNILVIMQGPPGSGKSRFANDLKEGMPTLCHVASTDDYFYVAREDGSKEYRFDPTKLAENHGHNLERAIELMKAGISVIVDNTNIRAWECRGYVEFAVANNIPVVFVRMSGAFPNSHGVSEARVATMRAAMELLSVETVLASKAPWEK